jgi:hypothetical protein
MYVTMYVCTSSRYPSPPMYVVHTVQDITLQMQYSTDTVQIYAINRGMPECCCLPMFPFNLVSPLPRGGQYHVMSPRLTNPT